MKGKPLLPTLRTKKRYVVYETISEGDISNSAVFRAVQDSFRKCFGIFGLGKAGLMNTKIFNKNKGIIKVNNKYLEQLRASIAMVTKIDDKEVILNTVGVSGILKKGKGMLYGG